MRRLLLALLFCFTAWATLAGIMPHAADAANAVTVDVCAETEAGVPGDTGNSDGRWVAAYSAILSVTESRWKSTVGQTNLTAASSTNTAVGTHCLLRNDRSARARPAHLLHVPLLI